MFEHIDTLTLKQDPQRDLLRALLTEILDRSLSVIVVRMRPGFLEKRRYEEQILVLDRGVVLLSFTQRDQLPQLMGLIKKIGPLHINKMRVLIGTPDLPSVLREKYASLRLRYDVARKNEWPAAAKEHIVGGLDPLDNDITIAGTQIIREIVDVTREPGGDHTNFPGSG